MNSPEQTIPIIIDGQSFAAPRGGSLLDFILLQRLSIKTACGGNANCHLCRVTITEGLEKLPSPSRKEDRALGNILTNEGVRLSCQVSITHPLTVTLPEFESPEDRRLRKKRIKRK